jgi:glycine/D-amino acid oxidase-like deaminating enzyme
MGETPDGLPHVGKVPGSRNQWLLAGFNGAGMTMIFTTARAIANMVVYGVEYEDTGLPSVFRSTSERLMVKNPGFS